MRRLEPYNEKVERGMITLYQSLEENARRRYAAVEAQKLGYGGTSYICNLFGCDESSVKRGSEELANGLSEEDKRIRKAGGGRKRILETRPEIEAVFLEIMTPHTAGSPVDENIKWSNLGREKIAEELSKKGFDVSVTIVDQLLEKHDFRRRQAFKCLAGKQVAGRDEQFKNIENMVEDARQQGNPVMSMDTKKKS